MNKKCILTTLLLCACCLALAPATSFSADQVKDKDETKDQLKDGSCQDLAELLQEVGAN